MLMCYAKKEWGDGTILAATGGCRLLVIGIHVTGWGRGSVEVVNPLVGQVEYIPGK
jgi:hypothetical protein